MAKVLATRGSQWPLVAEFVFNLTDSVINTSGAEESLATVGSHVFDGIKLPTNAIVIGGAVVTEVAASGPTAVNVSVGDSGNATRTALVPTGFVGGGEDLRITVAPTVAPATAGKVSVHVMYIIRNRMTESQTH